MKQTINNIAPLWLSSRRPFIRQSSYTTYSTLLASHVLPSFGNLSPKRVDEAAVQEYVLREHGRGVGVKTIRDSVMVLRMVLSFAEKEKKQWTIHYPEEPSKPLPVLSVQDYKRLVSYTGAHPSARNLGILICLTGGLRIGEVCALQWADMDLRGGTIRISKTASRLYDPESGRSSLEVGMPKTASSVREIPLTGPVRRMIRQLSPGRRPEGYIVSGTDRPMDPRRYRRYFSVLLSSLGIPPMRFHGLRHSFATRCIESRCDCKTVSAILGHSSVTTTFDLYVHPDSSQKRRCVERMLDRVGKWALSNQ